jgi:L-ascorbate metabolism protein UlaG (beta-lactamase superfamily)
MEITWLGHACFLLRGKHVAIVTDPFPPQPGEASREAPRLSKINATIVTVSHQHPRHNYVQGVGGQPRVVRGPGEYEISDVLITGVASYHDDKQGKELGRNTIYVIHIDDLVVCHLGDLGHTLREEQLEEVADVDILLLPIGGQSTINATQAAEVTSQVEPHIVIPMHYRLPTEGEQESASGNALDKFCREMDVKTINMQPKLTVTRANLPTETQVILLAPRV